MTRIGRTDISSTKLSVRKTEPSAKRFYPKNKIDKNNEVLPDILLSIKDVLHHELKKEGGNTEQLIQKAIVTVLKSYFKESEIAESSLKEITEKIKKAIENKQDLVAFFNNYKK